VFDGSARARDLGAIVLLDAQRQHILAIRFSGAPRKANFADRDYFTVH